MKYQAFAPPSHLQGIVQCYWNLESDESEATPRDYFLMADSCAEIIFQYNKGFKNYAAQSARMRFQHSIHAHYNVAETVGFFGVRLYPQAVNLLLGLPATEVVNEVFDIIYAFKSEGEALTDQVFNAKTTGQRMLLVSNFLAKKAKARNGDPVGVIIDHMIRSNGRVDISQLHHESGLSVKQFERRFKAIAGFAPKYFARILRFQSLKEAYMSSQQRAMTRLAYAANYYDQSHFNREFKEFSGVQPSKYFALANAEDTGINKSGNFEGYLPCGWFV